MQTRVAYVCLQGLALWLKGIPGNGIPVTLLEAFLPHLLSGCPVARNVCEGAHESDRHATRIAARTVSIANATQIAVPITNTTHTAVRIIHAAHIAIPTRTDITVSVAHATNIAV